MAIMCKGNKDGTRMKSQKCLKYLNTKVKLKYLYLKVKVKIMKGWIHLTTLGRGADSKSIRSWMGLFIFEF